MKTLIEIIDSSEGGLDYVADTPNFQWDGSSLWYFSDAGGNVILSGAKLEDFSEHECVGAGPEAITPPEIPSGDSVGETVALLDALARLRGAG